LLTAIGWAWRQGRLLSQRDAEYERTDRRPLDIRYAAEFVTKANSEEESALAMERFVLGARAA
jgi:hypothetical protein